VRFRWLRLPFGLKVSFETFQRKLIERLAGLKGVACIADDILVFGNSESDHDKNLRSNIKLYHDKSVFKTTEVEFLGHLITNEGLKPDVKKLKRFWAWETQPMLTELQKLSTVMEPIRRLTKQDVEFKWSEEQDKAMGEIKTTTPMFAHYNGPKKELVIQCDA
jgi:hypothetical protein